MSAAKRKRKGTNAARRERKAVRTARALRLQLESRYDQRTDALTSLVGSFLAQMLMGMGFSLVCEVRENDPTLEEDLEIIYGTPAKLVSREYVRRWQVRAQDEYEFSRAERAIVERHRRAVQSSGGPYEPPTWAQQEIAYQRRAARISAAARHLYGQWIATQRQEAQA